MKKYLEYIPDRKMIIKVFQFHSYVIVILDKKVGSRFSFHDKNA